MSELTQLYSAFYNVLSQHNNNNIIYTIIYIQIGLEKKIFRIERVKIILCKDTI